MQVKLKNTNHLLNGSCIKLNKNINDEESEFTDFTACNSDTNVQIT